MLGRRLLGLTAGSCILISLFFLWGCPPRDPARKVPLLLGMHVDTAVHTLQEANLLLGEISAESAAAAPGAVIGQVPVAGTLLAEDDAVDLTVSLGEDIVQTLDGVVINPSAAKVPITEVQTGLGVWQVDGEGNFQASCFTNGPSLAVALNADGNPMLMGWLDWGSPVISAHSTAEVLLFEAMGCPALTPEERARAIALLRGEPLQALENAIQSSLAEDPDSLATSAPAAAAVLQQTVDANVAALVAKIMMVEPWEGRSGVQIEQTRGVNALQITNMYRRRVKVKLYFTGCGAKADAPELVQEFSMPPVTGLNNTVRAFLDIYSGSLPYDYVHSAGVCLESRCAPAPTQYRLLALGMGIGMGDYFDLSAGDMQDQNEVAMNSVVWDYLFPFVTDVVVPCAGYGGSGSINLVDYYGDLTAQINDWTKAFYNLDGFKDACAGGNFQEAVFIAISAIADNGAVRAKTVEMLGEIVYKVADGRTDRLAAMNSAKSAWNSTQQVLNAVGVANIIMTAFDSLRTTHDLLRSNRCDAWNITLLPPEVALIPEESEIRPGGSVLLEVTLGEAETSGTVGAVPEFEYEWNCTRFMGDISDTDGNSGHFTSRQRVVTYESSPAATGGQDTVTVTVYQRNTCGDGAPSPVATLNASIVMPIAGILMTASPDVVPADGDTSARITAIVRRYVENDGPVPTGDPVEGAYIQFETSLGSLAGVNPTETDTNGQATIAVTSDAPGVANIVATAVVDDIPIESDASVTFIGETQVKIDPGLGTVKPNETQDFQALVIGLPPEECQQFEYHWSCSSGYGAISAPGGGSGASFTTDSDTVTYTADGIEGADTLSVEVWCTTSSAPLLLGIGEAGVTVSDLQVGIRPAEIYIGADTYQSINVSVDGSFGIGELPQFRTEWSIEGTAGMRLRDTGTGYESTVVPSESGFVSLRTPDFEAPGGEELNDTVTVRLYNKESGKLLGTASAPVKLRGYLIAPVNLTAPDVLYLYDLYYTVGESRCDFWQLLAYAISWEKCMIATGAPWDTKLMRFNDPYGNPVESTTYQTGSMGNRYFDIQGNESLKAELMALRDRLDMDSFGDYTQFWVVSGCNPMCGFEGMEATLTAQVEAMIQTTLETMKPLPEGVKCYYRSEL